MAIMNPIPGQEDRNSDYLLEHGAAIKINSLASLGWKVSSLLGDHARLQTLRANAAALGRPRAAETIARDVLKSVPGPSPR
jgi:processive 1,2-diacylglycerol beta-glucosyltransferase